MATEVMMMMMVKMMMTMMMMMIEQAHKELPSPQAPR